MTSKKTRRALFSSAISLLLCCSMLVGTTFAWFTDKATSSVNTIQAGKLDVVLEYWDGDSWEDAEGKALDFIKVAGAPANEKILWEPGCTYKLPAIRVGNNGDLKLKYEIVITGIDGDAELNEAIEWTYNEKAADAFTGFKGTLEPKGDAITYGEQIVIQGHMKENAGNEYQGLTIDGIAITVFATQVEGEFDSFKDDYDDGAYLPTVYDAAELASALENNESVQLGADIDLTGTVWTPIGDKDAGIYYEGTLDGAGHKITGLNVAANDYDALISAAKDATIKNLTVEGTVNGVNAAGIVARVEGNTVIENCASYVTVKGTTKAGGIVGNVTNANAKIINCVNNADISWTNEAVGGVGGIVGYVNNDAYLEIINCTNNGNVTSEGNTYAGAAVGYAAKSKGVVDDFTNTGVIKGTLASQNRYLKVGDTVLCGYVNTPGNWIVAVDSATELKNVLDSGEDVVLKSDITIAKSDAGSNGYGATGITVRNGQTFDGNGHYFGANVGGTWDSAISINGGTIKNLIVNKGFRGIFITPGTTPVQLENVVIDGTTYTISCDKATNQGLTATGCTFNGWTSFAATIGTVEFTDCSFGAGAGYNFSRPYAPATYENCNFAAGHRIDPRADIVLKNCTLNGVAVTDANLATLVTDTAKVTIQ